MRALDLVAADVVADDQVAEAVEAEATVISESSVVEQVVDMVVVDSEVPQHQLMEGLVDHLLRLLMAELLPMAAVVMVEDTETHQGAAAAANPGGKLFHNSAPFWSSFDSGTIHRPGTKASNGSWLWIRPLFLSVLILLGCDN